MFCLGILSGKGGSLASKFGGSYSRVDLACFHGKTFWRVCLAGQVGAFIWWVFTSNMQYFISVVSPTYGYIESALVKCSNEGGLGPRYNREEDPWSSIFSMLMVYGCYLHLLTFSRKQVTGRINGDPFPPFQPRWAEPPSLPPGVCTPPPANRPRRGQPQKITLQPLIRGRRPRIGLEDVVGTILGFSAPLYEVGQLSWRPAQVDQRASIYSGRALLWVISGKPGWAGTTKTHHGGPVRGMSLYKGSQCTFLLTQQQDVEETTSPHT